MPTHHTACIHAKVSSSGQTVATFAAHQVPFAGNDITGLEIVHMSTGFYNFAHKFVTKMHGDRDGFLGPGIPVVDVHVCAADGGFVDPY